jgi:hypothetical protein
VNTSYVNNHRLYNEIKSGEFPNEIIPAYEELPTFLPLASPPNYCSAKKTSKRSIYCILVNNLLIKSIYLISL